MHSPTIVVKICFFILVPVSPLDHIHCNSTLLLVRTRSAYVLDETTNAHYNIVLTRQLVQGYQRLNVDYNVDYKFCTEIRIYDLIPPATQPDRLIGDTIIKSNWLWVEEYRR